ncbi:MAG: formate/nitrite transporter family protein [Lachnospiraceae bacterium]|nr:formate/nitrite transporter family protein [Lachnospiraceae bacterium]
MGTFNSPKEITDIWIGNGVNKANLPVHKMILLGMAAGCYIGLGAHAFINTTAAGGDIAFNAMVAKLLGAALFPVGLMLVVLCGAELFTGNNLLTLALFDKKISVGQMLKNWIFVYIGNLIGSVLLAFLLAKSGLYADAVGAKAMAIATSKTSMPFGAALIRGIFCNMLVVLACWFAAGAKEMIGKIFAIWFPIMLFVFAGFEHSVANMTYIPLGIFCGADVTWAQFFLNNLLPVTIGNLIGGAILIPGLYYISYKK